MALVEPFLARREPSDPDRCHFLPGILRQMRGVVVAAEAERLGFPEPFAQRSAGPDRFCPLLLGAAHRGRLALQPENLVVLPGREIDSLALLDLPVAASDQHEAV